ncbi:MAG TPA: AbrB/MazE/SpoVT family DNA-binding domain-containing protein [Acetobacteraceae bacterium]|jgi:AbrB family looped-hinge helix DNA binding protein
MDSAITSKGQATIPKAIREHLGLRPGDRVKFFVHPDGTVVLLPKLPVATLRGIARSRRHPVTIEAMNEAIGAAAAAHSSRRQRR